MYNKAERRFMTVSELRSLLLQVKSSTIDLSEAHARILALLRAAPFENLGFARIDHHREIRQGFPEVIFGLGKTPSQIAAIAERLVANGQTLLITRAKPESFNAVQAVLPNATYNADACIIILQQGQIERGQGTILIASGGTADLPVAEEAAITAEIMGNTVERVYDVGIAGLHRLLAEQDQFQSARVVIAVAGMEGALPSVVAGLVSVPVIAVPTSVGYGANFEGLAALLGMMNSCASGVAVVNIDNGFGAACIASLITHG